MNPRKIYKLIVLLLILLGNSACIKEKNRNETADIFSPVNIKIEKPDISSLQPLLLSEFADSIEYIQLETSDQCLLPPYIGTFLTHDFIFIKTDYKLYQFDRKGKFIRQIGREGNGPGEFKLNKCGFDEENQRIFVKSYTNASPLIFDFNGKFLGNIKDSLINSCFGGMEHFDAGAGFLIYTIHPMDVNHQWAGKPYELIVYDYVGDKVTQTLINRFECKVENARQLNMIRPGLQTLTKSDSLFYYHSFYNDTLYAVSNTGIQPFAVVDFGKYKNRNNGWIYSKDPNTITDAFAGKMRIVDMFVCNNNIFLGIFLGKVDHAVESFLCKYDIANKKLTYHSYMVINDIDGCQNIDISGLNTGIETIINPEELEDKEIKIALVYSTLDKNKLKNPEQKEKFELMLKENIEKEDNPILMILHMKKK
ncbi:MAG: 6-bladed beta-propeller [Tannerella sp.]|jgi:hypothetical protein|nr:6-bladed beta-propeller [Tannerella sp.]